MEQEINKKPIKIEEWHKIQDQLCDYFGICHCQRKIKSIIDSLVSIYTKIKENNKDFTGAEYLLLAIMDAHTPYMSHGINMEYPIPFEEDTFWKWILEIKDDPNLDDN